MKIKKLRTLIHFAFICGMLSLFTSSMAQHQISPYMYGVNAWMPETVGGGSDGGNSIFLGGKLDDLWGTVSEANPRIIRIGGIVHDDKRPSTDQYVQWINAIREAGAEPLVQVSRGNDENRSTAAQAAALVNELNNVRNMNIKFWSIANEPDLHYFNFDLRDSNLQIITNYIKEYSDAMKGQDPNIIIAGPAFSNWKTEMPKLLQAGNFDISGISPVTNKPYIDIFDWHYYPIFDTCYTFEEAIMTPNLLTEIRSCGNREDRSWYGLRGRLIELTSLLNDANSRHNRTGDSALKWGISEFHITVKNPGGAKDGFGTASFLAGQYWADVMSISAEFNGLYAIGWSIHESSGANTDFDLGFLGGVNGTEKRATFYHLQMLSDYMSGEFLGSTNNRSEVKTFAVKDGDLYKVMIMNQGPANNGYNFDVSFNDNASNNLNININANTDINFSGFINNRETKIYIYDTTANAVTSTVTYNLELFQNNLPPTLNGAPSAPIDRNLITNGDFSNGLAAWDTFVLAEQANANISVNSNGELVADINNGGTDVWNVQQNQTGLNIENGKTYMLSFDASAAAPRAIGANVEQSADPFAFYGGLGTINLTTERRNFSSTFTMENPTDTNARLTFNLGIDSNNVTIDNVVLKEVEEPLLSINESFLEDNFNIFPIPVTTILNIENKSGINIKSIAVYDLTGKKLIYKKPPVDTIDFTSMESGYYMISILSENGYVCKKIIKQ